MIEGIQHTPTQAGSHAELQARQGWSVAAMRDEMDAKDQLINAKDQLIDALKAKNEALTRQINGFQSRVGNALRLLKNVHCGNTSQALVNHAQLELGDVLSGDVKPLTKTLTAGEMAQDQTCFIEVSTLAPFDGREPDDYILFHIKSVEGGYIQLLKSKPVVVISEWAEYEPQKRGNVIPLDDWQKAITEATAKGSALDGVLTELAKD